MPLLIQCADRYVVHKIMLFLLILFSVRYIDGKAEGLLVSLMPQDQGKNDQNLRWWGWLCLGRTAPVFGCQMRADWVGVIFGHSFGILIFFFFFFVYYPALFSGVSWEWSVTFRCLVSLLSCCIALHLIDKDKILNLFAYFSFSVLITWWPDEVQDVLAMQCRYWWERIQYECKWCWRQTTLWG